MAATLILASGWAEASVGLLWFALSLLALFIHRAPLAVAATDLVALMALLLAARWSGWGLLGVLLSCLVGLVADPTGLGFSSYICACVVTLLVRKGQFGRAAVATAVIVATMVVLMRRRSADVLNVLEIVVVPSVVLFIAWVIGLGFRWVARVEAERVSKEFVERQMRMAVDIHDFVGRNLTGVLVRADSATAEQRSDPAFLDELIHRVRSADATLREVTADLQREGSSQPFGTVGAVDAARAGVAELTATGFVVEQAPEIDVLLAELPPEVDLVVSRIIAEALHNVLKHGDKAHPCRVGASRNGDLLTVVVTNVAKARRARERRSLGLVGMRRHAALAGGTAASSLNGETWTLHADVPITRREGALT